MTNISGPNGNGQNHFLGKPPQKPTSRQRLGGAFHEIRDNKKPIEQIVSSFGLSQADKAVIQFGVTLEKDKGIPINGSKLAAIAKALRAMSQLKERGIDLTQDYIRQMLEYINNGQ